jgi:hypothetical protein
MTAPMTANVLPAGRNTATENDVERLEFNLSGVTMGDVPTRLARLRNAVRSICRNKDDRNEVTLRLNRLQTRLVPKPGTGDDPDAIAFQCFSKKQDNWLHMGWVPAKKKIGKGKKRAPINKLVAILHKKKKITGTFIEQIGKFNFEGEDGETVTKYYCKVSIEFTRE